jgi:phospholipid/cholesterol/gamma-HCH transport system permease protein
LKTNETVNVDFIWNQGNINCTLQGTTFSIKGSLQFSNTTGFINEVSSRLEHYNNSDLIFDLNDLEHADSAGITAVHYLAKKLRNRNINVQIRTDNDDIQKKLEIFKPPAHEKPKDIQKAGFFERIGEGAHYIWFNFVLNYMQLTSNVFYWSVNDIFRPKARRKGEFFNQSVLIGVNAILIVSMMAFIIGLVLALQSAVQLRDFGANIYIVDLTVIAMMREMGPLITAILVAGRSGSAIAAEIATMKVTSEIDALTTMGLNPIRFVVVPKMYGSLVTMPFLTIIADVMGILGGMLVAALYLDITPYVFVNRMGESLYNKDIIIGFIKSFVFAGIIVLTGSFYGFRVDKGAEGVGRVTTTSVVVSISLVIVADSILGILLY